MRATTFLLALLVGTTACREDTPVGCEDVFRRPVAGAGVSANVDGRRVAAPRDVMWFNWFDVPSATLVFNAWAEYPDPRDWIHLEIRGFQGVGTYPIAAIADSAQTTAYYGCETVPASYFVSTGAVGDSVRITTWDSVTGLVRGDFAFHASGPEGEPHLITDGMIDIPVRIDH